MNIRIIICLAIFVAFGFVPKPAAAQYDRLNGVFIVSPAKQEINLDPGESIIRNIYITNKLGRDADFAVAVEDVSGGTGENEVVKFYGEGSGPYSIKKLALAGSDRVRISDGDTKAVPVMITVPLRTKPGGYYGGVFFSELNPASAAPARILSRIGSLMFLRIKGNVLEQGELTQFSETSGRQVFWRRTPIEFSVRFSNTGNTHLNPYGLIEIKDFRGRFVRRLPIEPWFVFPDSVRRLAVKWPDPPSFGYFSASLYLNHGYANPQVSVAHFNFLIVPLWAVSSLGFMLIFALMFRPAKQLLKKWQI
jgi:hypothetical protein